MKTLALYFFLLCCAICSPIPSSAADRPEVIMGTDDWPPFTITDKKSPYGMRGIDVDLLELLARRMDLTLRIRIIPWSRSLLLMKAGKIDLLTGLAHTKERAEFIRYTEIPYYTAAPAFYVARGNRGMIRKYSDLYGHSVGYVRSSAYFKPFDTDSGISKYPVSNEEQLIRMLALRRLDVIIGTDCQIEYDIARLGLQDKVEKAIYLPDKRIEVYVGMSKKSHLIHRFDELNRFMKVLIQSGEIEKLASKYFQ